MEVYFMAIARFFPGMLTEFADQSGISVPEDADGDLAEVESLTYDDAPYRETHVHFFVFCLLHLGQAFPDATLEENARILATMTEEEVKDATIGEFTRRGMELQGDSAWD
jgi:hypothetical protein